MSIWDLPDFPAADFETETITIRPRQPSGQGTGGAPTFRQGEPVEFPAQIDPISGDVAIQAGIEDIRAKYEVHLSADPGPDFDEGSVAHSETTGPARVIYKLPPRPNHCVFVVQGRR